MSDILTELRNEARAEQPRILLPESHDERVLEAAARVGEAGIATPVLFGPDRETHRLCEELSISLECFDCLPRPTNKALERYAQQLAAVRDIAPLTAERLLQDDLVLAALLVRCDEVDGLVAGAVTPTAEVVGVANGVIGLDPQIDIASSYFLMLFDDRGVGENGALLYADCGVNVAPTSHQLADIAVTTADTAETLLGWDPRLAMLSFSTKGSADHDTVEKVRSATALTSQQLDDEIVDGELQFDAALVPSVAERKVGNDAQICGDANTLIFPNLDAGNIAYKLTERLAGAQALGPILQGYARPLSDLSRGASTETICDIVTVTAARAARNDAACEGDIITRGLLRRRESTVVSQAEHS